MEKKLHLNLLIIIVIFVWLIFPSPTKAADWALSFDGEDDYVLIPTMNAGTVFSIECWFYQETLQNWRTLFKDDWTGTNLGSFYLDWHGPADFSWWLESEQLLVIDDLDLNIQTWYHFVFTADGTSVTLYINGDGFSEQVSGNFSPNYNNDLEIGKEDGGTWWDGRVDEVRTYNRALSAEEVQEHYQGIFTDETGLMGLWHSNEGSGPVAYDSSGYGNDADIYGATWVEGIVLIPPEEVTEELGVGNSKPIIQLETLLPGTYSKVLPIYYFAYDPDSGLGDLKAKPIGLFYSNDGGISWKEIARDQPNAGIYNFETTKIPDGTNYIIKVAASDGYGRFAEVASETFAIDNTGPTFDISISPSSVREKDTIELKITSSEKLKAPPEMQITQEGAEPITVTVSGNGRKFSASYYVVRGYRGEAVISISGEDFLGNVGETISSGESFLVERYGPPPPIIQQPLNNQVFTQPTVNLIGTSELDTEVIVTLNEVTKWTIQPSSDGSFRIDDITLSLTTENKGYNILRIVAFNKKGEDSEEVTLKVKLNSPPKILSTSISSGEIISGEKEITWTASDLNDDKLVFSIEYSNDGGITWDFIVSDFSETSYKLDTTQLADGSNYFLRVTADDGTEKISDVSEKFTIKNNLPHIALDIPPNYFTNTHNPSFTGKVTGSEQNISSVEYSLDRGETWHDASALDGQFGSLIEKIEIAIADFLEEGKHTILIRTTDVLNRSVKISRSFNIDITLPFIELPLLDKLVEDSLDTNLELNGLQVVFQGETEPAASLKLALENEVYRTSADEDGQFAIKDVTLWVHGSNKLSLSSTDLAGNISQISGMVISNNLPQISILHPEEGKFLGEREEIIWQVQDLDNDPMVFQILYQKKDKGWVILVKDLTLSLYKWDLSKLTNGDYKIKIIASDGINETEEIANVFIDNVVPQVVFGVLGPSLTINTRPAFSGQASDDFSGIQYVEYSFNNVDWYKALFHSGYQTLKASFRFRHQFPLADGDYKVMVRATDLVGNITYSEPQNLIVDNTAPYIGSNLISADALALFPDETGAIKLFEDTSYKILISVAQDVKEVILSSKETIFDLNFNQATLLWESEFNFQEIGDYPIEITTRDELGNSQTKEIAALKIVPPGVIYSKETNQPIKEAKATLFVFDQSTNSWLIWDGQAFNQENPQETKVGGEYGFLVPPGKYHLEVSKPGFETVRSKELEIKNNYLINIDIPLTEEKGIFNKTLNYFIKIFSW